MPRRVGDVPFQLSIEPEIRRRLIKTAADMEEYIPTPRVLDRTTMVVLMIRAFLDMSPSEQRVMLLKGAELAPARPPRKKPGPKPAASIKAVASEENGSRIEVITMVPGPNSARKSTKPKKDRKGTEPLN